MKTTHRIIACLIALICFCAQRAAADSPLTSTDFHQAYADEPIVAQIVQGRTPSDETWAYLAAPDNPVAVKMAIINKIGWAFEGKNSYQLFLSYLKRQGICKREKDLYQKRPGDLLLTVGAGDVTELAATVLADLAAREGGAAPSPADLDERA